MLIFFINLYIFLKGEEEQVVKIKEALQRAIDKCTEGLVREESLKEENKRLKQQVQNIVNK